MHSNYRVYEYVVNALRGKPGGLAHLVEERRQMEKKENKELKDSLHAASNKLLQTITTSEVEGSKKASGS